MAEVLHLIRVARSLSDSRVWVFLAFHQTHVDWVGCSHDLIQPPFSFLVGVALPFSIASRTARGQSYGPADSARPLEGARLDSLGRVLAVGGQGPTRLDV